jgi:hypothetical protein
LSERVLDTGTRGVCCTRALFVPARRKVLQPCRSAHTPSMVLVRILESSLATHTRRPVLRGYAHGGGKGHLRGARTDGLAERTERARTYHGTHGTAAPIGYYAFSQRAWRVLGRGLAGVRRSWALGRGAGTRGPRRLGHGTGTAVGAMVRLREYSQGTRRVLAGYSWARAWADLRGAVERDVRGTRNGDAQSTSTRGGTANHAEHPRRWATAGAAASVLTAACGEGTLTAVRWCGQARAGVLTDKRSGRRSHAGARRGIARAAGAQETQQLERRQRGGDRAVERVIGEIPATCMVRPAVQ